MASHKRVNIKAEIIKIDIAKLKHSSLKGMAVLVGWEEGGEGAPGIELPGRREKKGQANKSNELWFEGGRKTKALSRKCSVVFKLNDS